MLYENFEKIKKQNIDRMEVIRRITYTYGINISEPGFLKRYLVIQAWIVLIMSSISVFGHIFFIAEHFSNVFMITESLCTCLQILISIIKLFVFIFIERRFYQLVKSMVQCELFNKVPMLDKGFVSTRNLRNTAKDIIEECWRRAQGQIRFYVGACITIISFYFFNALIINTYHDVVGSTNHSKIFPFKTRYPPRFEKAKEHFPYYPFFMLTDGFADFAAGMVAATFDGYYVYLTFHAVASFKVLKEMISFSVSSEVSDDIKMKYAQECIQHYNRSIRFCDEINEMYSLVNISQLIISLIVLGVVLFQASVGLENDPKKFINMVLYISAGGYELVIFCFDGQNLTTETETIIDTWYSCNWYNESRELKTIIYMMMLRTRQPYYITAWHFTTMTLPTFMSIVKTSGSYFMLLRNLTQL